MNEKSELRKGYALIAGKNYSIIEIEKRVNCHDDLLNACKIGLQRIKELEDYYKAKVTVSILEEAISKAESKEGIIMNKEDWNAMTNEEKINYSTIVGFKTVKEFEKFTGY